VRITFVLPSLPWAPIGGFRTVYEYANYLVSNGHDVVVVHARELGSLAPVVVPARGVVVRLRALAGRLKNRYGRPRVWWQHIDPRVELRYPRELAPDTIPDGDAVVATSWVTSDIVAALAPRKGRKFYLIQDFYPYQGTREALERSWRLPMTKVAISSWLADLVAEAGSEAVANPIAVDHATFALRTPIATREARVTLMCSTGSYKALDVAIDALERVRARRPGVQAETFGALRRPAALPEWVVYRQGIPQDELVDLYNRCAVYLCSSNAEGFALPPAEALACGCAVATTDCGGNREYAEHGVTALVSRPGDAAALAQHVFALLEDRALRIQLAQAGMERVRGLTWQASARRFEGVVASTVAGDHVRS
jgi:L-malate glycosyltransferase